MCPYTIYNIIFPPNVFNFFVFSDNAKYGLNSTKNDSLNLYLAFLNKNNKDESTKIY
jgi:hypothetical protein